MQKNIGTGDAYVLEPTVVSDSRATHEAPANNMQKYIPQNGGQIQAGSMEPMGDPLPYKMQDLP